MKKTVIYTFGIFILLLASFFIFAKAGQAQAEEVPKIKMVVSLQQKTIRLNDQVPAIIVIANQSKIQIDSSQLNIYGPGFLLIHRETCRNPAESVSQFDMGALAAHASKSQILCFSLDPANARSGAFNVLLSLSYSWAGQQDLVTEEKEVAVDLIGSETILGIPLAFAGFVLPGMMLLITLNWFKVSWSKDLTGENRFLYGILISLAMLGPLSWLAVQPRAPTWLRLFNFFEKVTIESLIAYVVLGFALGALISGFYHLRQKQLNKEKTILSSDEIPDLIRKSLGLNPAYKGGQVTIINRKDHSKIVGSHFVVTDSNFYIFPEFRLYLDQLDPTKRDEIAGIIRDSGNTSGQIGPYRDQILSVVKKVKKQVPGLFVIAQPVVEYNDDGTFKASYDSQNYLMVMKEDYSVSGITDDSQTYLLEMESGD